MTPEEMKQRTKEFGLRALRLCSALPRNGVSDFIARQLAKCATSVGANYRSACRSRSDGDFLARMGVVEEEADEALYWMEVIQDACLLAADRIGPLAREGEELLSIVAASIKTVKARLRRPRGKQSEIRNPRSEI